MSKPKTKLKIGTKNVDAHFGIGFMERVFDMEDVKDSNIMNVPTFKLMSHAIAYAAERKGEDAEVKLVDIYDWIDSKGINSEEVTRVKNGFLTNLLKSLKTHLPDKKSRDEADKVIEGLSPAEKKKGKGKTGKKM